MNKELINKYKHEFDHWLNEGKVLHKHANSNYWCIYEPWDYSPDYVTAIIINDEYVELRKALAEGKAIEYLGQSSNVWHEVQESDFNLHPTCYRIKPDEPKFKIPVYFKELSSGIVVKFTEEISSNCFGTIVESSLQIPQKNKGFEWRCWDIFSHPERWEYLPNYNEPKFKVGDFVTHESLKITRQITKVDHDFIYFKKGSWALPHMKGFSNKLILWTPVKGEWCWFYDSKSSKSAALVQFKEKCNDKFISNNDVPWHFCEPFLNSLPSYLKDK